MFWDSIESSFITLTHWQIYVAGLLFLTICFAGIILVLAIGIYRLDKTKLNCDNLQDTVLNYSLIASSSFLLQTSTGHFGRFFTNFLLLLFKIIAIVFFVQSLTPIILGFSENASWNYTWNLVTLVPDLTVRLLGVLLAVGIFLHFIPVLGRFESFHTLILGSIVLLHPLLYLETLEPSMTIGRIDFIPDLWFSFGLLAISVFIAWLGMMVIALLVSIANILHEGFGQFIIPLPGMWHIVTWPIISICGFLPVFIYGAWLGTQINAG